MYQPDYDSAASHWIERDSNSVHMEPATLKEKNEAFISVHNTCALATASADIVHNTPIEFNYVDSCFYFFYEGGLKFKGLKENKNVGIAIFEPYGGFGQLESLQVQGQASVVLLRLRDESNQEIDMEVADAELLANDINEGDWGYFDKDNKNFKEE